MPVRLDSAVAESAGLSRSQARSLIMEGRVSVDGTPATKPGQNVRAGARIDVRRPRPFVSRGGEKLAAALTAFSIEPRGAFALDVGASTGGFTDCLLQRGAAHVTAVDVGYGQLDWKLRTDPRVTVLERTNFRNLGDDAFPGGFDLIAIDASFISLRTIAARAAGFLRDGGDVVALLKPQFEAGRERLGRGGVVRDPAVHLAIVTEMVAALAAMDLSVVDAINSPLLGPAGNREFLLRARRGEESIDPSAIRRLVDTVPG